MRRERENEEREEMKNTQGLRRPKPKLCGVGTNDGDDDG